LEIEIVTVGKPYKEGRYGKLDVEYIRDGNNQKRKLAAVGETKDVVDVLAKATPGEHYEIEVVKNGDFYNWNGAKKVEKVAPEKKTSYQAQKNTYETPDERARRQLYIVKQSSIANALEYFSVRGQTDFDKEDVLELAQEFVEFVFSDPIQEANFENSKDDIPWNQPN
jgi:predicted ribonuclease toxin of YeeF-YezG toxin-antitoxin module